MSALKNPYIPLVLVVLAVAASCSRKNNTFMTRNFQALNTSYNVLYNGDLAFEEGRAGLAQGYKDDFWETLPVERVALSEDIKLGSDRTEAFDRAEEKAIKAVQKRSIYIDGWEYNPKIDEVYILLGKSRYYDSHFISALEAFNYVLSNHPTSNSINAARIWRDKTYIRLNLEEIALKSLKTLLEEAELDREDMADASAMMAQAYINMNHPDSALAHIEEAAEYTRDKAQKGRYLFIKGQLYNAIGEKDSANIAFDEVIALKRRSPRTYMIHAEVEKARNFDRETGDEEALLKHFDRLIKNRENRPFLGILYHQLGEHHRGADSTALAMDYYNRSLASEREDGKLLAYNYLALGDIYFDDALFRPAGAYYDSTLQHLEERSRLYRQIRKKRDNLDDVIYYEDLTRENDSILELVDMSEAERLAYFIEYTDKLREKAIADSIAQAEEEASFRDDEFFKEDRSGQEEGGKFYFYNATQVARGRDDFRRRWGNRRLEDDWRRSDKGIVSQDEEEAAVAESDEETVPISEDERFDPQTYISQIPSDGAVIDSISRERDMGYYQLGLIYHAKFKENELAAERLETLLGYSPELRLEIPAKYHLVRIYELLGKSPESQRHKNDILTNHPDSQYAEILRNPMAALGEDEASPERRYAELFALFEHEFYQEVIDQADNYITMFAGDEIVPRFELLKATAIGRQQGFDAYKKSINFVALNYPNSEEGKRAKDIYDNALPKLETYNFAENEDSDRWKLVFEFDNILYDEALRQRDTIEEVIEGYSRLYTSMDYYTDDKTLVVVHGFTNRERARSFGVHVHGKEEEAGADSYPYTEISSPNYEIVQVHKNLDEYINPKTNRDVDRQPEQREEDTGLPGDESTEPDSGGDRD